MLKLKIPATSANLGPGFDTLGIALKLYNTFTFSKIKSGLEFRLIDNRTDNEFELNFKNNLVYIAMKNIFDINNKEIEGIRVVERVSIPFSRGMGSSATAILAGITAGNYFLNLKLTEQELLNLAIDIEGHADNILPAYKGGLVINALSPDQNLVYKKITVTDTLKLILVIPDFEMDTKKARELLPDSISYEKSIFNTGRTALLAACFMDEDWEKLSTAMEDKLHQDYRAKLIPGYQDIIDTAYKAGAVGAALSGAGPTILALARNREEEIAQKMAAVFSRYNLSSRYIITTVDNTGLRRIDSDY